MHSFLPLFLALTCLVPQLAAYHADSMTARGLLQQEAQPPKCAWSPVFDSCTISKEASAAIINETPDSAIKTLMLQGTECNFVADEDVCGAMEHCRWSEGMGGCTYKATRTDYEHFQNCLGKSSIFLSSSGLFQHCQNSTSNEVDCNIAQECGWDSEKKACEFDAWKILTGLGSESGSRPVPRGMKPLMDLRVKEITEKLAAEGITEGSDILAWKPPPMQCPDGVDVVLCILVQAADKAAITKAYCQSKSKDNSCGSDPLCEESCEPAKSVLILAERALVNGYIMLIDDTTAALILRRHVECLQRPELECPKDKDCIWDADSAVCEANGGYVLRTISQYPLNEQNPECETVKPLFMAGCTGLDKEPCGAKNSCLWDEKDDFCIPSPGLFILGYLESINADDNIKDRVAKSIETCSSITQNQDCA